jgi:hypothetical protein
MSVVINGTGSISGLSNVGGISSAQSGSVIQVIQAATTTQVSSSSSSPTSTTLSGVITPQFSNSKILVMFSLGGVLSSSTVYGLGLYIYRNGSAVWSDVHPYDSAYYNGSAATVRISRENMQYLDSPATTSACTYTVYFAVYTGTMNIQDSSAESRITLMEIAG